MVAAALAPHTSDPLRSRHSGSQGVAAYWGILLSAPPPTAHKPVTKWSPWREGASGVNGAYTIQAKALAEWLRLAELVAEIGAVPCRTSDPEAWWPDKRETGTFETRMAVDACSICGARDACLSYALAADEADGMWGGTLPDERRQLQREAA